MQYAVTEYWSFTYVLWFSFKSALCEALYVCKSTNGVCMCICV